MADALLGELLQELDLAVIEWLPGRTFRPFAPLPKWFKGMAQWSSLPFLEHFLPDAEEHWRTSAVGVLTSDMFTIDGADGELLLRARALKLEGRLVMAIERLVDTVDARPVLRQARQQALDHEQLVSKTRQLHAPLASLQRLLPQLEATTLSAQQQPIVDAVGKAAAHLRQIVDTLPAVPAPKRTLGH